MSDFTVHRQKSITLPIQMLTALIASVAAVALPQLCHLLGSAFGMGTAVGEMLLPMHLPVLLCGLLAGPLAGMVAGVASPLISFGLTGMPLAAMLPVMLAELASYGIAAGLIKDHRLPVVIQVLIAQAAGRLVRALTVFVLVDFGLSKLSFAAAYTNLITGLPGTILQLALLPLILRGLRKAGWIRL